MIHITTPEPPTANRNVNAFVLRILDTPQGVSTITQIEVSESIPESFLTGWTDYQAGRVVDMDRALSDEPPPI
jgi:hypothetical protein